MQGKREGKGERVGGKERERVGGRSSVAYRGGRGWGWGVLWWRFTLLFL